MRGETQQRPQRTRPAADHAPERRRSYLLRVWEEPRELPGETPLPRALLRDLETGEERWFGGRSAIGDELAEYLFALGAGARDAEGAPAAAEPAGRDEAERDPSRG